MGVLGLAVMFCSNGDPLKVPYKADMCRVECEVFNGNVYCAGKTEEVWSDFLDRELRKSEHNYRGPCKKLAKP